MPVKSKSFPFIRQRDAMQCGVACLTMIALKFGIHCTLEDVEEICVASSEGVSLKAIADGAKSLGLKTISTKSSINHLVEMDTPCVLHWDQKHFVVLYHIDKNGTRFWIADPAKGKYKISADQLQSHWISTTVNNNAAGIAIFFLNSFDNSFDHQQRTFFSLSNPNQGLKFLWKYIIRYKHYFIQILLALSLGCVLQMLFPYLTQLIVDKGIGEANIKLIWIILIGEVVILFGRTSTDFIRRWITLHISMRINITLISDFFVKLLKLPMHFFDSRQIGDLMQRISDHTRIQNFLTGQLLGTMFSVVSLTFLSFLLLSYNLIIFSIFIAGSTIYAIWALTFLHKRKIIDYEIFEQFAINKSKTYQFISSLIEIKLHNCEDRRRWDWENTQANLYEIQMRALKLQQTQEAGSIFINETKNIFITVIAAYSVIEGDISLGVMMAIQYIVGQLNSPIEQLMGFLYAFQDVKISLDRIDEIHRRRDEDGISKIDLVPNSSPEITFFNIDFKYDPHSITNILQNINIKIRPSQITAIVGESGSGKSTLIKLMLGYYNITNGDILINNTSINNTNHRKWRSLCGVVMQESCIFSDTIANNIAISKETLDKDRLLYAASIACIKEFIESLPLGFNTLIGQDGLGLSQGQKQRILIARAIYKNPSVIFFDEATNSLDAENEIKIMRNLQVFFKDRTVVIAAHRLSTVRNADQIIVLNKGTVVESGTHDELINLKGVYYNLVKNQLDINQ